MILRSSNSSCFLDALIVFRGFLHDPEDYPEPMEFRPERFLEVREDGTRKDSENSFVLRKDVPDPRTVAFGFGRRYASFIWQLILKPYRVIYYSWDLQNTAGPG